MRRILLALILTATTSFAAGGPPAAVPAGQKMTAESRYNDGLALKGKKDWTGAETAFRQATVLKPNFHEAWSELGHALKREQRFDDSIRAYQKALALKADYPPALEYLGEAYAALGRKAEAEEQLAKLRPLDAKLADQLAAFIANPDKRSWD